MAVNDQIDNNDSKASELSSPEELDLNDQVAIVTDENDPVEPLDRLSEEIVSAEADNESGKPDSDTFNEVLAQSSPDAVKSEHPPQKTEADNPSETTDEQKDGQSDVRDPVEPLDRLPEEIVSAEADNESGKPDSDTFNEVQAQSSPDAVKSEHPTKETEADNSSEIADEQKDGQSDPDELDDDGFLGLDAEEFDDEPPEGYDTPQEIEAVEGQENVKSKKKSEEDNEPAENQKDSNDNNRNSVKSGQKSKAGFTIKKLSPTQIVVGLTLFLISIAGGVFYMNPSLFGFKKEAKPVPLQRVEPTLSVQTASKQVESVKPFSKSEIYLAKIKNAGLLRDELLEKKEEIYRLKLHYQNGIADLEEHINRELQKEGLSSYTEALKNRSIELNLRTIQRRLSYIHGLEKPTRWIKQGSEELLYLKRKAEFDLQLCDIVGGIDMDRHMRHISAAIQRYRPGAQKLAVDRENTDLAPLETIWDQIKNQKRKAGKVWLNVTDEEITKEICSGNYERSTELTSMSAATAQCLSKMNGSDLFLNGVTTLSPAAAKYLFQWHGSWICINGVKELSPAAAQYLFKWEGNWISLNGLIEFPPGLATYLMEWEGKQLELMGLRYNKKNADEKALKYLALWETMGGKLFISDDVRKEIERVMM
jgi:hypothetical protein